MRYNKDYFTGMKHLADAILYELDRLCDHYYYKHANTKEEAAYYADLEEGIGKAMDVVEKVLHMQLAVKGDEEK